MLNSGSNNNSSQEKQRQQTTPTKINSLRKPTVPLQKISKPKQWNQTWAITGIQQPFKVNKIERLHNETRKKGIFTACEWY